MDIGPLLSGIGAAAVNPLAFVAYLAAIIAWAVLRWRVGRGKNLLQKIDIVPADQRAKVLLEEMGIEEVPGGFTAEQRIKSKIHRYYFLAFVILCAVLVVLFAISKFPQAAKVDPNTAQKVKIEPPDAKDVNRAAMRTLDGIDLGMAKDFIISKLGQPQHQKSIGKNSCIDYDLPFASVQFILDAEGNVVFKYVVVTDAIYKPDVMSNFMDLAEGKGCLGCFSFHDLTLEVPAAPTDEDPHPVLADTCNRRVTSFGLRYDYARRDVKVTDGFPAFVADLRHKVAKFAGRKVDEFQQGGVNEYPPGAGIGWHKDKPQFGVIVGVSLLGPATMRFRRAGGTGWIRASQRLEPRSIYILEGEARTAWEHSVPPVDALRYSLTFRTVAKGFTVGTEKLSLEKFG